MRVLARLAVLGVLVISCRDNIVEPIYEAPPSEPYVCEPTATDTLFGIYLDSIRVVVGAVESIVMDWATSDGCTYQGLPPTDLTWTIRDSSVVRDTVPEWAGDSSLRWVLPKAPGRTMIVVEGEGRADSIAVSVPDTVAMGTAVAVAAGPSVSCAVTEDGTAWCWGGGSRILGDYDDPKVGTCMGVFCSPMPVAVATGAESVWAQPSYGCVLDAGGTARCWGENSGFQLGVTTPEYASVPVEVSGGHTFASLSLGWAHACGVTTDGVGYCWGESYSGKLGGNYRLDPRSTPLNVDEALNWIAIEARQATTCGVSDEGHVYCWGILGTSSESGPPGSERCQFFTSKSGTPSSSPCSYTPLRIPLVDPLGADSVFARTSGTCALTTQGSVYCYSGSEGAYRPRTDLGSFESLSSGASHTCGIRAGGTAACWGANWAGQLGDGTTNSPGSAVSVSGGQIWDQIAAGGDHTCGLSMGEVWCWGASHTGQAGTSILEPQLTPAKAHGQD